ncbi:hypothetical protein [Neisseria dentiae]|uniref:hypothetical protein n=1 Tax=Neisseria dentiae TaxID=194197 RepID=UPI00359F8769
MCGQKCEGCGRAAGGCGVKVAPAAPYEDSEVWQLVKFHHDYDLVEEAARASRMAVPEFIAYAAAEYADLYLKAYEAALEDVAAQIRAGCYE